MSVRVGQVLVLLDSMLGHDPGAVTRGLLLGRCPGQEVTADLDVVVGELAKLVVIHTEELGLLAGAQVQTGDEVDNLGENGREDKGVSAASHNVGDLDVKLLPVVVDPSAVNDTVVDAVQTNNVVGSEESVEDEANNTADTVLSEHIERVVDLNEKLDYEGI